MKLYKIFLIVFILSFGCEQDVSVTPPDSPPPTGKLIIDSKPHGFNIYINGRNRVRKTPDSLTWLETGEYKVNLKKEYFYDTNVVASVRDSHTTYLMLDYTTNYAMLGDLILESNPTGAEIFINDSSTTLITPHTFRKILPGEYKIRFKIKDHRDVEFMAIVRSRKATLAKKSLIDTTLWDHYNTENSNIPSNSFLSVNADYDNIIYAGTKNGLVRYDGKNWELFTASNSELPHSRVNEIKLDENGFLWLATNNGIALADQNNVLKKYRAKETNANEDVFNKISVVAKNLIRFLARKGELSYSKDQITGEDRWNWKNSDSFNYTDFLLTPFGNYYGTESNGLTIKYLDSFSTLNITNSDVPTNHVSCIDYGYLFDGEFSIWVGFGKDGSGRRVGLLNYSRTNSKVYKFEEDDLDITDFYYDPGSGYKFVGTNKGVILFYHFDKKLFLDFENTGLNIENVTSISEGKNYDIWITSATSGLFVIKDKVRAIKFLTSKK